MKFLQRIWRDFRQGENIDLYITVVVSIVLTVLNIVSIVPSSWIAPLSLTILALLSIAILGNRYRIETILERIIAGNGLLLVKFQQDDLSHDIDKSRELMVLGIDLRHTLQMHYALFERKIQRGDAIKILLLSPDSPACDMAATRYYEPINPDDQRAVIRTSLRICHRLSQEAAGKIEIRMTNCLLSFGAIVADPETSHGAIYLWHYSFKTRVANQPKMVFHPTDGYWYEFFKEEVSSIWNCARPWLSLEIPSSTGEPQI